MAHRNRWLTVLKHGGSFHGELLVITRGYFVHYNFLGFFQVDWEHPSHFQMEGLLPCSQSYKS